MSLKVEGTELVFESEVCGKRVRVKVKGVVECGSSILPDERHEDAIKGVVTYIGAVQAGRTITDPQRLEQVLREEHRDTRIMAKDMYDRRSPICWDPSKTTFKKL